jgi:hypothetical protein
MIGLSNVSRGGIPWIVSIVLSCWCLVATLSLLIELPPLVGKWSWLANHFASPLSSILLGFGSWAFEAISAYRELVGEPGRSLHLTPLPQYFYDVLVLFVCLLGLGFQLIKREALLEIIISAPVLSARLGRSAAALIGSVAVLILLFGIAEASFHWWNSISFGSREGPGPTTQPRQKAEGPSIPTPEVPPGPPPSLPTVRQF